MPHLCVTEILHEVFILLCVDIFNFSLSLLFLGHNINSLCFYITDSATETRGLRALKMIPCISLCWYLLSFFFSFLLSSNVNSLRLNIADSEMETIWHVWCLLSQLVRFWYLSHRWPAKAQASLRIRAVSPQPSLFEHMNYGSRQWVRQKIKHIAPLDGCACAFEEWVYKGWKVP